NPDACKPRLNVSSGLVFLPRMPAIIRLRTSGVTMSGMKCCHWQVGACYQMSRTRQNRIFPACGKRCLDMRLHGLGDKLDHRNHNGIPELTIGLGIGNLDPEAPVP